MPPLGWRKEFCVRGHGPYSERRYDADGRSMGCAECHHEDRVPLDQGRVNNKTYRGKHPELNNVRRGKPRTAYFRERERIRMLDPEYRALKNRRKREARAKKKT